MDDELENERNGDGRRTVDSAHLLKWVPFLSLFIVIGLQTIYFTRYVAGMELKLTASTEQVGELKAEMKALTTSIAQGAVPAAQNAWKIQQTEALILELKSRIAENERLANMRETRIQRLESAVSTTNARVRAQSERQ